jgi:hypothetical protein
MVSLSAPAAPACPPDTAQVVSATPSAPCKTAMDAATKPMTRTARRPRVAAGTGEGQRHQGERDGGHHLGEHELDGGDALVSGVSGQHLGAGRAHLG